jgi:CRISPR-associated protein Csm1
MDNPTLPNLLETALGGMLQDIGKFMQRAHGSIVHLPSQTRALESVILPPDGHGGYSHTHALWTEAFFHWMEEENLTFPPGVNLHRVRDMAVFHHKPEACRTGGWSAAEANRLTSGREHKSKDELLENEVERPKGWDTFIKTPMLSPFCQVNLGLGEVTRCYQPLAKWLPGDHLLPVKRLDTADYQDRYCQLWQDFSEEFKTLCQLDNPDLFCEGLLSLSERYTSTIPSSTTDLPDISLHDHNRTVAAIAACLFAWHTHHGRLDNKTAIEDRNQKKFRFLSGDLVGIQDTLFLLANPPAKTTNRILHARSFLMAMLLEATALRCRKVLGLSAFNLIQNGGGRFLLLVPDLPNLEDQLQHLREEIDTWMLERYLGELVLNLGLSDPFAGADLLPQRFSTVQKNLSRTLDEAKLRALPGATGVLTLDYDEGECIACGVRPARHRDSDARHCHACHDEHRVGSWLPKTTALSWQPGAARRGELEIDFFGEICLHFYTRDDSLSVSGMGLSSGYRLYRGEETLKNGWPLRFIAHYVPTLGEDEVNNPLYAELSEEAHEVTVGDIKTFEHLAQDAREIHRSGFTGKPWLALLKADVDHLGLLFGIGLHDPDSDNRNTLSRYAALSRMMEFFFSGYLPQRLRERFPNTYVIYAGGDAVLLISPWRQMVTLSADLNRQFRLYTGENPDITLSAGLALVPANQPLNRAIQEAEERLERVRETGRNRICLIDAVPIPWEQLAALLELADTLTDWLHRKLISTSLLYQVLYFTDQRQRAEQQMDMTCANWRAHWAYDLVHNVRANRLIADQDKRRVIATLNRLLGLDERLRKQTADTAGRIPVSVALYRN